MENYRRLALVCVIFLFGTAAIIFMANIQLLQRTRLSSACGKLYERKDTSYPNHKLDPSSFIISYKENFFHAKCEAPYPVQIVVDFGKVDRKNLGKIWTQSKPCDLKGEKIFSSEKRENSYKPYEKFKMGFTCVPLCDKVECAERTVVEYSGDGFITLENQAFVRFLETREYWESYMGYMGKFITRVDFKLSLLEWKGFLFWMAVYVGIFLASIYIIFNV